VEPSKTYLARAYIKGYVESGKFYFRIRWFNYSNPDPNKYGVGEVVRTISPNNYTEWTEILIFTNSPKDACYADIVFNAEIGVGKLYADDFDVRELTDKGTFTVRCDEKYLQIPDWEGYADLLTYGILDRYYRGNQTYLELWNKLKAMCTPEGIEDKAFNFHLSTTGEKRYETYKVALILIIGKIINEPIPYEQEYVQIICKMQMPNGGVKTHFLPGTIPDSEAKENIETTCLAIYALYAIEAPSEKLPIQWASEVYDWAIVGINVSVKKCTSVKWLTLALPLKMKEAVFRALRQ